MHGLRQDRHTRGGGSHPDFLAHTRLSLPRSASGSGYVALVAQWPYELRRVPNVFATPMLGQTCLRTCATVENVLQRRRFVRSLLVVCGSSEAHREWSRGETTQTKQFGSPSRAHRSAQFFFVLSFRFCPWNRAPGSDTHIATHRMCA